MYNIYIVALCSDNEALRKLSNRFTQETLSEHLELSGINSHHYTSLQPKHKSRKHTHTALSTNVKVRNDPFSY